MPVKLFILYIAHDSDTENLETNENLILVKDEWNFFGFSVDAPKEKISIFVNDGHIPFNEQESNDFVLVNYDWISPIFSSGKIILGMNIEYHIHTLLGVLKLVKAMYVPKVGILGVLA